MPAVPDRANGVFYRKLLPKSRGEKDYFLTPIGAGMFSSNPGNFGENRC